MPEGYILHVRHTLAFDRAANQQKGPPAVSTHNSLKNRLLVVPVHFGGFPAKCLGFWHHWVKRLLLVADAFEAIEIIVIHESDKVLKMKIGCHQQRLPG